MVLEQNQNLENNNDVNDNINNEIENNNKNIVNNSNERLPSIQRNNAYGNNFENQKKNLNLINRTEYNERKKTNKNKYYNSKTYQNKISDSNNGLYHTNINNNNNQIKSDFEEQPGNLTMLNNHPEFINMSSNTTMSDIYKNPKYNTLNIKNNLQNRKINNNILTRNINNDKALFIKDNSEEEIKSIKDRIRKKYKSPPRQNNNINQQNYNEIKPYEHIPSYQIKNDNQKNINSSFVKINNSYNELYKFKFR